MTSSVQILVLIAFATGVSGCAEETLPTEIPKLGPITSVPPNLQAPAKTAETKREPSAPVGTLIRRAEKMISTRNLPAAIGALEEALVAEPTNRKALRLLADVSQVRATELERPVNSPLFLKSAQAIRTLRATYKDLNTEEKQLLPTILYNEACTFAVNGERDKAMKSLTESFENGFLLQERIDNDEELDTLRKVPEFVTLQRKLEIINIDNGMAQASSRPLRFDFKLPDLDGKMLTLNSLKGKIVVVDVWGMWCAPCRRELPHLVALYRKYKDKGVEIVGIDYEPETGDSINTQVRNFLKDNGVMYPCLVGDDRTRNQIPEIAYPTTLFIDRDGKVRLKLTGYHSIIPLETAVEKLLAEGKSEPVEKK